MPQAEQDMNDYFINEVHLQKYLSQKVRTSLTYKLR